MLFQFARITQKLSKFDFKLAAEEANPDGSGDADDKDKSLTRFSDRFYRTLYELILKIHMSKVQNLDEFFGLVFKAIIADKNLIRCVAFLKRMLQLCYANDPNFAAATLLIFSEILKVRNDIRIQLFGVGSKSDDFAETNHGKKSG